MVLAMLLGGLRAGEVRGLLLADVDHGLRRLRVVGKGGRERVVPVDRAFFIELATYLRDGTAAGMRDAAVFRGAARSDRGVGADRGGTAAGLPHAPSPGREFPGSDRTGCGTPTAPNSPAPGSTCWCCGS